MSVKWTGVPEFRRQMATLKTGTPRQVAAALYQEGQQIMTRSKAEFVPVRDDILRPSGQVALPVFAPGKVSVELGYGGAAAAYALAVHEHPSGHSPASWRGTEVHFNVGGPKYLERPVNEAAAGFGQRIAARIRRIV